MLTKTGTTTGPNGKPIPVDRSGDRLRQGNHDRQATGFPTCSLNAIEGVTAEVANEACKKSKIGSGHATVLAAEQQRRDRREPGGERLQRRRRRAGNPVVLLHAYGASPVQVTQVLVGTVTNYNKEGFGPRLDSRRSRRSPAAAAP